MIAAREPLAAGPLMRFDESLLHLINQQWTCKPLDWWAAMVTASEVWIVPIALFAVLLAWKGGPRGRTALVVGLMVFVLGDVLLVHACKVLTSRPRPKEVMAGVRSVHLADVEPRYLAFGHPLQVDYSPPPSASPHAPRSFPSGH